MTGLFQEYIRKAFTEEVKWRETQSNYVEKWKARATLIYAQAIVTLKIQKAEESLDLFKQNLYN